MGQGLLVEYDLSCNGCYGSGNDYRKQTVIAISSFFMEVVEVERG